MLPKTQRIRKKKDFDRIFKIGKVKFATGYVLKYAQNELDYSRFGIIVGLKVAKKAVVRNRIKRKIRGMLEACHSKIRPGFEIVIICTNKLIEFKNEPLNNELMLLFKKSGLYKNNVSNIG
jgi:ribonuclease P protein component